MKKERRGGIDIPVRRHGTVPAWAEEEPSWELEAAPVPRTIGEYGAAAVWVAALLAAGLAGLLLYAR